MSNKDRSKLGRLSRNKGAAFERRVAQDMRPIFGSGVKRGLAQARFGRGEAPDVDGCAPFWCETKHGKKVNLRAALKQATEAMSEANRTQDAWPIAVCKDDRQQPMVVMHWGDYLQLLEEWWPNRRTIPSRPDQPPSMQAADPDPPSNTAKT